MLLLVQCGWYQLIILWYNCDLGKEGRGLKISSSYIIVCAISYLSTMSRKDVIDQYSFYCQSRKSIEDGSFIAKSRLTLQKWLLIIYLWSCD